MDLLRKVGAMSSSGQPTTNTAVSYLALMRELGSQCTSMPKRTRRGMSCLANLKLDI